MCGRTSLQRVFSTMAKTSGGTPAFLSVWRCCAAPAAGALATMAPPRWQVHLRQAPSLDSRAPVVLPEQPMRAERGEVPGNPGAQAPRWVASCRAAECRLLE